MTWIRLKRPLSVKEMVLIFLAVCAFVLLLHGCAPSVYRDARRSEYTKGTLRIGNALIPYDHKDFRPRSVHYYKGGELVCIFDKKGSAWQH